LHDLLKPHVDRLVVCYPRKASLLKKPLAVRAGQLAKHPVGVEKVRLESILFVLSSAPVARLLLAGNSTMWSRAGLTVGLG
jgi:hypothetical protein